MYRLFSITRQKRGIQLTQVCQSDKSNHFKIALKALKRKDLTGWIIFDDNKVMIYNLPKCLGFNGLDDFMARFQAQNGRK